MSAPSVPPVKAVVKAPRAPSSSPTRTKTEEQPTTVVKPSPPIAKAPVVKAVPRAESPPKTEQKTPAVKAGVKTTVVKAVPKSEATPVVKAEPRPPSPAARPPSPAARPPSPKAAPIPAVKSASKAAPKAAPTSAVKAPARPPSPKVAPAPARPPSPKVAPAPARPPSPKVAPAPARPPSPKAQTPKPAARISAIKGPKIGPVVLKTSPKSSPGPGPIKTASPKTAPVKLTPTKEPSVPAPKEFTYLDAVLKSSDPEAPYRRRESEEKNAIHIGQLKLVMSEIQFFTRYWNPEEIPNPIAIYAGAAPGFHIPFLVQLFPSMTFHLYDPRPFGIKETDNIKLHQQYFEEKDAAQWANRKDTFLISDIRTADFREMGQVQNETQIIEDMRRQEKWYLTMKPVKAVFKFRPPYPLEFVAREFEYLAGTIYIQAWAPQTSTETRLVPSGEQRTVYDIIKYQDQMFYINSILREQAKYLNPFTHDLTPIDPPDLTNDYDSSLHTLILTEYLTKVAGKEQANAENVIGLSRVLIDEITKHQKIDKITPGFMRAGPYKSTRKLAETRRQEAAAKKTASTAPAARMRRQPAGTPAAPIPPTGPATEVEQEVPEFDELQ